MSISQTISQQTSPLSPAITNSSSLPNSPSFTHFINIKLNRNNFLLWKAQLIPYLRSQNLLHFVDGSIQPPTKYTTQTENDESQQVINPEYTTWYQRDQWVLSVMLSSLTEKVLSQVLFLTTATEAWSVLQRSFASSSKARILQVRLQLSTTQKKEMNVSEYFHKMKNLADILSIYRVTITRRGNYLIHPSRTRI